ncbi:MAG TPA: hypothetical protein VM491_17545, partial [Burkholderiaceae bacterium]|nr:hypothetical protein [Burkholderiaceae bacterium]
MRQPVDVDGASARVRRLDVLLPCRCGADPVPDELFASHCAPCDEPMLAQRRASMRHDANAPAAVEVHPFGAVASTVSAAWPGRRSDVIAGRTFASRLLPLDRPAQMLGQHRRRIGKSRLQCRDDRIVRRRIAQRHRDVAQPNDAIVAALQARLADASPMLAEHLRWAIERQQA